MIQPKPHFGCLATQKKTHTDGPRYRQDASEQYASLIKKETGATKVQQGKEVWLGSTPPARMPVANKGSRDSLVKL